MALNLFDAQLEYSKNENLKKDEITKLVEWANQQPHLPKINEVQAITSMHCCQYQPEAAKQVLNVFFATKSAYPGLFKKRNPLESPVRESLEVTLFTPLPEKTPEGYTILFLKLMDPNPAHLLYSTQLKIFDMVSMLVMHQDGTSKGYCIVIDMKGGVFGHLYRVELLALKRFMYYIQEAMPGMIKQIHFFNAVPFMDKVLSIIKPFFKKELAEIMFVHKDVDRLAEMVPKECLPGDYGGRAGSTRQLHESIKKRVFDNVAFFEWEDEQIVEQKQVGGFWKYFSK